MTPHAGAFMVSRPFLSLCVAHLAYTTQRDEARQLSPAAKTAVVSPDGPGATRRLGQPRGGFVTPRLDRRPDPLARGLPGPVASTLPARRDFAGCVRTAGSASFSPCPLRCPTGPCRPSPRACPLRSALPPPVSVGSPARACPLWPVRAGPPSAPGPVLAERRALLNDRPRLAAVVWTFHGCGPVRCR